MGPPLGYSAPPYRYGPPVREQIAKIHDGILWYLVTQFLSVVSGIGSALVTGYVLTTSVGIGNGNLPNAGIAAASIGAEYALGLLGLLVLVLTLVSWVKWRSGIRPLPDVAMEYGPAYATAARSAAKDYSRTIWTFIGIILASIIFALALAAYLVSQTLGRCAGRFPAGNNSTCLTPGSIPALSDIVGIVLAFGLLIAVFQFLLYFFASRSLVDAIRVLVSDADRQRLDRGRLLMVVGAGLTPLGLVNAALLIGGHSTPALGFIGLIPLILIVAGLYSIHRAYSSWLSTHTSPTASYPAAPPPVAIPYGYPPAPPGPPRP